MNALLHSHPLPLTPGAPARVLLGVPAKAAGPPVAVAARPHARSKGAQLAAAVVVLAAHAAPLALGLPLAAVPLVVGGLGVAAIVLSRWSPRAST